MRVLLVEDSEPDAKLVLHELRQNMEVSHSRRVENAASMREALESGDWDVIICDWSMPDFSALDALELLKSKSLDTPFIVVSGTIGEELAVTAMRAGARDYVLKDNLARLAAAVQREIQESSIRRASRHSEDALRSSEARFARLSESGVVGIVIADVLGNILEANDAYLGMLGYTRGELLSGKVRWEDMTPPEFKHLNDRAVELLTTKGAAPPWETEQIRKDGSRVSAMIAVAMLDYPKCIAVITDLSERRKTEAVLRDTEKQLRQAQKMEAIGILAGGVAHDFNNLLSVILGYSDMLMQDLRPDNPMRADLAEIKFAGERGSALTRQLLAFSRQQVVEPITLDLNEVISNIDKMLRRLIREDVNLVLLPAAGLGKCKSDAGQIEQIVMNLVINASDAMPEGGTLTIETENANFNDEYVLSHLGMKPGHYVMLAVSDTGLGMNEATQARIFEPFFTTKEKGKGTGLGLSTVFGIVQQSGGSVRVYSEPGKGSTFKVYMPRTNDEQADVSETIRVRSLLGSETVLLVEDEDQIRNVTKEILRRHGYAVLEARNGGEALRIFEQEGATIHLVLTDVIMPEMNGQQLAGRISALRPGMKVVFMSGYTDGILSGQLSSGAAFLQKPFTPTSLTKKIREVLDSAIEDT